MFLPLIFAALWMAAPQKSSLPPDFAENLAALERAREADPNDLPTLDALAGSYAMVAEYQQAIAVLQHMRALSPQDHGLELRLARNFTWAGDTKRAIAAYDSYLRVEPGDRQATIELIRLRRYRGDYSEAEELCDRLLAGKPDDAEALALKAEVLHWAGDRRSLARRTADQAAALAQAYPDAKVAQVYASLDRGEIRRASDEFAALEEQIDRQGGVSAEATYRDAYRLLKDTLDEPVHFTLRPWFSTYNDSDGIHDSSWGMGLETVVARDHKILLDVSQYRSSAPEGSIFTGAQDRARLNNFHAGARLRVGPAAYLTLLGGASQRGTDDAVRPVFHIGLTASPLDRWTFDFSAGREFLGVTPRAIDRGISSHSIAGSVRYAFDSRTYLSVRADRRYWSDSNDSIAGEVTLRRTLRYNRRLAVDAGLLSHWEHFEQNLISVSGFFTPDRYDQHDASLSLHGELLGLRYEIQGSGGAQQISRGAGYRPDWDVTPVITVPLGRWFELSASYQRRNYSLLTRDGWYQGLQFTIGIKR